MKYKRFLMLTSLFLAVLLLFTACASPTPANLTADEIAARQTDERYAYTNAYAWTSMEPLPEFKKLNDHSLYQTVVELTICSEISSYDALIPPNVGDPPQKVTGFFIRGRVETVLDESSEIKSGDELLLWIGSHAIYPEPELYRKGDRYVMFIYGPIEETVFSKEFTYYEAPARTILYLTEDHYLLPMSDTEKTITDCTGMHLDNFKSFVKEQFK